ncbi:MAG: hypothetical protein RBS42_03425 [Campylobacterales bacterium]|jgi:hypothetical protein|nr:hypothetical protein [Campylobacterales bacterium]NLM99521.1 hypothetical protein [Campylobacteraceae bacterium]
MRRDSLNLLSLKNIALVSFLILYQVATSFFPLLSPLLGLFFTYGILIKEREVKSLKSLDLEKYFAISYVIFIELSKGFFLFSTILFYIFYYSMVVEWIKSTFKCRPCIVIIFVSSGYIGVLATNNLLAYIVNRPFFHFSFEYIVYIAIDSFLAILLFKDRIL